MNITNSLGFYLIGPRSTLVIAASGRFLGLLKHQPTCAELQAGVRRARRRLKATAVALLAWPRCERPGGRAYGFGAALPDDPPPRRPARAAGLAREAG